MLGVSNAPSQLVRLLTAECERRLPMSLANSTDGRSQVATLSRF